MKCTVVSFFPREIQNEEKPGLYPGSFSIGKSDGVTPQLLVVDNSVTYVYLDETRGSLPVNIPGDEVARSIVDDFCKSIICFENGIAQPGMFWIPGDKHTPESVLKGFKDECVKALKLQKSWLVNLVKMADDDWNKYHNLKAISELQRFAAAFLNLERAWNVEAESVAFKKCDACQSTIPVDAIVCSQCNAILDSERYKKFQFAGK